MADKTLKKKFEEFIIRESKLVLKGIPPQDQIMINMAFGVLLRYVQNAKEEELRERVKELVRRKEEIYRMLDLAKEGKLKVKDKKMKAVYPYLQKLLSKEDNVIKKIVDDFYKEFENEVKDSKDG